MSKIIKAADLKVLVTNESHTVIPAVDRPDHETSSNGDSTILNASNLLEEAQRRADEILAEADEEVQRRREEFENELNAIRLQTKESGFAEGYEEGLVDGREKALQEANNLLEILGNTVKESARVRASGLQALEDDFLKLSLLLADKIVRKSIETDISWLQPIIKNALSFLGSVDEVIVLLNPMDYALVQDHADELQLTTRTKLTFEQDVTVTQGGCLIECESGLIDARLEKRLGKIANHLMEVLYDENE